MWNSGLLTILRFRAPCVKPIDTNTEYLEVMVLPPDPNLPRFQTNWSFHALTLATLHIRSAMTLIQNIRKYPQYKEQENKPGKYKSHRQPQSDVTTRTASPKPTALLCLISEAYNELMTSGYWENIESLQCLPVVTTFLLLDIIFMQKTTLMSALQLLLTTE